MWRRPVPSRYIPINYLFSCNKSIKYIEDRHDKSSIQQEEGSFNRQIGLAFKEETSKVLIWKTLGMVLKIGHFGKQLTTPGKFRGVVLVKDGDSWTDRVRN
jgi:hypothetical protein